MSSTFIHLNNHSHFSLLRGVPSPQDWARQAQAMGHDSMALTDTNHTGGLILFLEECKRLSVKPILGVHLLNEHDPEDSLTLLARNMKGYSKLCGMTSQYMLHHREDESFEMSTLIAQYLVQANDPTDDPPINDHLIVFSSSLKTLKRLFQVLEKDSEMKIPLYAELISQCPSSRKRSREVLGWAQEYRVQLLATNANYFIHSQTHEVHQVMRAIHANSSIQQLNPFEVAPQGAWMKESSEMCRLFARVPEAIANTLKISELIVDDWEQQSWLMPKIEVPKGFTDDTYLKQLALEGLNTNYPQTQSFTERHSHDDRAVEEQAPDEDTNRIDVSQHWVSRRHEEARQLAMKNRNQALEIQMKELEVITSKGYSSYFLMVKQIRDWANDHFAEGYRRPKDCSVLRGSAANSITLYNLGASELDPIRYGLYFERFLNEDRVSPPDADLDFGWDERDKVIQYMIQHFGEERCAMMCTTNTFRWKSAFREVAKVYGYTDDQITRLMREWKSEVKDAEADRKRGDKSLAQILKMAKMIEGKPHFLGQHPGGILISNEPITQHVACQWSGGQKNRKMTQIDMHNGIDYLGLIKFDILGNGSLSVLRDALNDIKAQGLDDPHVWDLEKCYADPSVQDLLATSQSRGVFYVESPAQMRLNLKCDARTFEEIGITSSLVRPASASFTQTYVERHRQYKRGVKEWSFLHPSLSGVLGETHDVVVYQEDVIRLCVEVAGLSFAQADKVRKMMNSMHEGEPENYGETARQFQEGCMRRKGFSRTQASELWKRIASFQGFSFCQSHSLSYAQLSFKCSYLKAHYGAEFMAAVISNEHGYYGTSIYVDETRRMGITVLPPCVQESQWRYVGRKKELRVGLMHVRGVRQIHVERMIEERERGPWLDFRDFMERNPQMGQREIQALIKVSAFDGVGRVRGGALCLGLNADPSGGDLLGVRTSVNVSQTSLMAELNSWWQRYKLKSRQSARSTSTPLENLHFLNVLQVGKSLPQLPDVSYAEKCLQELELLGYITSGHYLKMLALHPAADGTVPMAELGSASYLGRRVKIFGSPMTFRRHRVHHSGQEMLFVTMQDLSGTSDLVLWPRVYERFYTQTLDNVPLEVWGVPKMEDGAVTIEVERIRVAAWSPGQVSYLRSVEMKKRQVYAASQMNVIGGLALKGQVG